MAIFHPYGNIQTPKRCAGKKRAQLSAIVALLLLAHWRLDPMELLRERKAVLSLAGYYRAVTVPFVFAGGCTSGALTMASGAVSLLCFWVLLGAGAGCSLAVRAIWYRATPGAGAPARTAPSSAQVATGRVTARKCVGRGRQEPTTYRLRAMTLPEAAPRRETLHTPVCYPVHRRRQIPQMRHSRLLADRGRVGCKGRHTFAQACRS